MKKSKNTNKNIIPSELSLSKLKKGIRDSQRIFSRSKLPADKILEHKRKIDAYVNHMERRTFGELERKHQLNYRRVKFFEIKKAQRKLKDNVKEGIIDFLYIKTFPRTSKYVSLYAGNNEDNEGIKRKEMLLSFIKDYLVSNDVENVENCDLETLGKLLEDNIEWIKEDKWNSIVKANEKVYNALGINDIKSLVEERKRTNNIEIIKVEVEKGEEENDDFFT